MVLEMRLNHHYVTNKKAYNKVLRKHTHTYVSPDTHLIDTARTQMARHWGISLCVYAQTGTYMHAQAHTHSHLISLFLISSCSSFSQRLFFYYFQFCYFRLIATAEVEKKTKENVDVTQNVKLTSTYPPNSFKANQPYAVQFMSNMFMCKFYMVFGLVKIKRIKMKESDKRIGKNGIL